MYLTKNRYEKIARFVDIKDVDFFHQLIEIAKLKYEQNKDDYVSLSDDEIKQIKENEVAVIYASSVTKRENNDNVILRTEMNDRATRKYMIIDADYKEGEDEYAKELYNRLVDLSNEYETQLIIYPTISYPKKPRFRAVLFPKSQLTEASYVQAMRWLYSELKIPMINIRDKEEVDLLTPDELIHVRALDSSNFKIRSNNNVPFFINSKQLDWIYDNTQEEGLSPIPNGFWKDFPKPKLKKAKGYELNSDLDTYVLENDEALEKACKLYAQSYKAQDYNTFWMFLHSIARAEYCKQITPEQVNNMLEWIAEVDDESLRYKWKSGNKSLYKTERSRVFGSDELLTRAMPLLKYIEFEDVLIDCIMNMEV